MQKLVSAIPNLSQKAGSRKKVDCQLGDYTMASVILPKKRGKVQAAQVDLREYFKDDEGELVARNRGTVLSVEEWQNLCKSAEQISNDMQVHQAPQEETPSDAADAAGDEEESDSPAIVDLTGMQRAFVSKVNDTKLLNLEAYTVMNGKAKPGKKGIRLTKEQAEKIMEAAGEIWEALTTKMELVVPLGSRRYARVDDHFGPWNFDIREYREVNGEERAGAKGLNMTKAQYKVLKKNLTKLISEL